MAGNEWINGYLEAILDAGSTLGRNNPSISSKGTEEKNRAKEVFSSAALLLNSPTSPPDITIKDKAKALFSPTKYFVEEVVNSFDESDLHRTWIKK